MKMLFIFIYNDKCWFRWAMYTEHGSWVNKNILSWEVKLSLHNKEKKKQTLTHTIRKKKSGFACVDDWRKPTIAYGFSVNLLLKVEKKTDWHYLVDVFDSIRVLFVCAKMRLICACVSRYNAFPDIDSKHMKDFACFSICLLSITILFFLFFFFVLSL